MAEERRADQTRKSGISHFPLEEEQARQDKVHENANALGNPNGTSTSGNQASRQNEPQPIEESGEPDKERNAPGEKPRESR